MGAGTGNGVKEKKKRSPVFCTASKLEVSQNAKRLVQIECFFGQHEGTLQQLTQTRLEKERVKKKDNDNDGVVTRPSSRLLTIR